MKRSGQLIIAGLVVLALLAGPVFGQPKEDFKRGPFSATVYGTTGLFTIFSADTMKKGEFAISFAHHNYDRDPGDIDFDVNPVSLTIGLSDRLELSLTANMGQSVDSDGKRVPAPTQLGVPQPPWRYRYYHDVPFQDRSHTNGMGDFLAGMKLNLLSEERGNPMGLALRGFVKVPSVRDAKHKRRGRGTGEVDGGFDLILSKIMGKVGTHYNAGVTFVGDPGSRGQDLLDLRDELRLGFGLNVPVTRGVQGVFEVNNTTFIGGGTPISGPVNPVDLFGGIRFYPNDSFYIGAGYRHFINSTDSNPADYTSSQDHHGYTLQMAFQRRVNAVPVLLCDLQKNQILEGESTTLTAKGSDLDYNAVLSYKWNATGGRIEGTERNATWYSESSKPGNYTVTVSVTDNRGATVSCSKDITLLMKNYAPTVSCEPKTASVMVGESVRIRATASDPNNDRLTYEWTIGSEKVAATGPEVTFGSAGRKPGTYQVTVRVSDGQLSASCGTSVTVNAIPNKQPVVSCSGDRAEVMAGERVTFNARGSDPDNDTLTYQWSSTGGRIEGSGQTVSLDTSGLTAGTYVLTVRVSDGRGGSANSTCSVNVRERIRILVDRLRIDNVAKAVLDDVALKLQGDPRIQAVITGYTDDRGNAKSQEKDGMTRADETKKYLVEKHRIDPTRLTTKSGGSSNPVAPNTDAAGRKQNRRVEIELYIP